MHKNNYTKYIPFRYLKNIHDTSVISSRLNLAVFFQNSFLFRLQLRFQKFLISIWKIRCTRVVFFSCTRNRP